MGSVCMCVCNSHRQVPANKARSVLPQVQRGRRGGGGGGGGGVNEGRGREGGGREGGRKRRAEGAACSPLIPSNIPLDDRARPKER